MHTMHKTILLTISLLFSLSSFNSFAGNSKDTEAAAALIDLGISLFSKKEKVKEDKPIDLASIAQRKTYVYQLFTTDGYARNISTLENEGIEKIQSLLNSKTLAKDLSEELGVHPTKVILYLGIDDENCQFYGSYDVTKCEDAVYTYNEKSENLAIQQLRALERGRAEKQKQIAQADKSQKSQIDSKITGFLGYSIGSSEKIDIFSCSPLLLHEIRGREHAQAMSAASGLSDNADLFLYRTDVAKPVEFAACKAPLKKKSSIFTKAAIQVDPATNKVSSVWGFKDYGKAHGDQILGLVQQCKSDVATISGALKSKFGSDHVKHDEMNGQVKITGENRMILITCFADVIGEKWKKNTEAKLIAMYSDTSIRNQSTKSLKRLLNEKKLSKASNLADEF